MHKKFSCSDIDILTNLSCISKVVECHFNYVVNMKRHRYGAIENDAEITRLICRLDSLFCFVFFFFSAFFSHGAALGASLTVLILFTFMYNIIQV